MREHVAAIGPGWVYRDITPIPQTGHSLDTYRKEKKKLPPVV